MPLARHRRAELEEHLRQGRNPVGQPVARRQAPLLDFDGPASGQLKRHEARVGHRQVVFEVDVRIARQRVQPFLGSREIPAFPFPAPLRRGRLHRAARRRSEGGPPGRAQKVDRGGVGPGVQAEERDHHRVGLARQRQQRLPRVLGRRRKRRGDREEHAGHLRPDGREQLAGPLCRFRPEREVQVHAGHTSEGAAGLDEWTEPFGDRRGRRLGIQARFGRERGCDHRRSRDHEHDCRGRDGTGRWRTGRECRPSALNAQGARRQEHRRGRDASESLLHPGLDRASRIREPDGVALRGTTRTRTRTRSRRRRLVALAASGIHEQERKQKQKPRPEPGRRAPAQLSSPGEVFPGADSPVAAGRSKRTRKPPSGRFAAPIVPPCSSTIFFAIARPSPVPPLFAEK